MIKIVFDFEMIDCKESPLCFVLTNYVIPLLGIVICNAIWFSWFPSVYRAFESKCLGVLDPYQFPFIMTSTFAWILYSIIQKDPFIYFANIFGFMISLHHNVLCIMTAMTENSLSKTKHLNGMIVFLRISMLVFAILSTLAIYLLLIAKINYGVKQNIAGILGSLASFIYYFSSIPMIYSIIKNRNSRGLYTWVVGAGFLNTVSWFFYGLVLVDPYVYYPNAFGILVYFLQFMCLVFPKIPS
jgi:uncharacterized protein with PQ loop repeat